MHVVLTEQFFLKAEAANRWTSDQKIDFPQFVPIHVVLLYSLFLTLTAPTYHRIQINDWNSITILRPGVLESRSGVIWLHFVQTFTHGDINHYFLPDRIGILSRIWERTSSPSCALSVHNFVSTDSTIGISWTPIFTRATGLVTEASIFCVNFSRKSPMLALYTH